VTGNQILSYGGKLTMTQSIESYENAWIQDQDIIMKGNGITLFWTRPAEDQDKEVSFCELFKIYHNPFVRLIIQTYTVTLHESQWHHIDRNGPRVATRSDLLTVLSNIESILVRATPKEYTESTAISDIVLDTAVKQRTNMDFADDVEVCRCPTGYRGTSCEVKYYST
jgi:hypothetical protein